MAVFYELVELVNRSPINLTVTFDGQEKTLTPGINLVPNVVVEFAKNQNPIMGQQDPNNPHISGGRYLVAVKDYPGEECEPLTDEEWANHLGQPQRQDAQAAFDERYGGDPKAKMVTQGRGRKSTAGSRVEASGSVGPVNADFSRRD